MAEILQPQPNESIYDPACGSGGMLVRCLDYLRNKDAEWQNVQVFGQEANGLTSSIAQVNLYLNGVEDLSIACADTLKHPAFLDDSYLRKFGIILANPPYSIKEWNREKLINDEWGRSFLGTPPQGRANCAFLQHIIASMNETQRRCAILSPRGVPFRDEELELREKLVEMDVLGCIVGLEANLLYNPPMEACILIYNCSKANSKKNRALMINAVDEVTRRSVESMLLAEHIQRVVDACQQNKELGSFSRIVSNDEIREKKFDLNISLCVYQSVLQDTFTVSKEDAINVWISSHSQCINEMDELIKLIK